VTDVVIGLAVLGVWIYCIFEVIASEATVVRNLPKLAWLVIVVLLGPIGALAWIFLGRPRGDGSGATRMSGSTVSGSLRRASRREVDEDDPAALEARIQARERLMQQWAEEDRRRSSGEPPADSV
jgi:hypothetical protein